MSRLYPIPLTRFLLSGLFALSLSSTPAFASCDEPTHPLTFTIGGDLRLRGEGWSHFNFEETAQGVFGLSQLRLHTSLAAWDYAKLYVEALSALSTPRDLPGGNRTIDVDSIALQNAYLDLKYPFSPETQLLLRTGRQEVDLGKQRLVSSLAWVNSRRTFDGLRLQGSWNPFQVDAFYLQPVHVKSWDFNQSSPQQSLYGLYGHAPVGALEAELYWLGLHKANAQYHDISGIENRHTLGTRWATLFKKDWNAEFEGAWQWGMFTNQAIQAGFVATEVSYQPGQLERWANPRFSLGFDYASGDASREDKVLNTFNQLYPLAHAYYSISDVLARQNAVDARLGVQVFPLKAFQLSATLHQFWRASTTDDIYGVAGSRFREGGHRSAQTIGTAIDLVAKYKFSPQWDAEGGYSYFLPGRFIADSGQSSPLQFIYLSSAYHF